MKRTFLILLVWAITSIVAIAQTANASEVQKNDKAIAKHERRERPRMTDADRAEIRAAKDKIRTIKQKYKKDKSFKKHKNRKHKGDKRHKERKQHRHHRD